MAGCLRRWTAGLRRWRDILATNSEHIERALGFYIQHLEHIRENLRTRQLEEAFERGADLARQLRNPR